jgi:2-polyprenyl-3-methyl-5-hydroxy-6-metoxy-1,4-benzoquinol methylase
MKNHSLPVCRFCGTPLRHTFVDLGMQPLCESYVSLEKLNEMEPFYPLHTYVCINCFLVQLQEFVAPKEIFSEYAYFSSYSDAWLTHAQTYVNMITNKLGLNTKSLVLEVASNDGYLLQYFVKKKIPVLGVEPAANVAEVATKKGVTTLVKFFDLDTANELARDEKNADLLIGNNVLAQVPDLNAFVESTRIILKPSGVITMEFPHLMKLIDRNQFDTIYHEHFSYFSFISVEKIFAAHGLTIYDVEELPTHGGSLRIYARHVEDKSKPVTAFVTKLREFEVSEGLADLQKYFSFAEKVRETKRNFLYFLINLKRNGKSIVGYGAPGKGNTLLNYCGIRTDFLDYTVDRNPYKQGKFLPGTHVPILHPDKIRETKPDYVLILPWNIKEEIMNQLSYIRDWSGRFVVPIPEVKQYKADGTEIHD